MTQMIPEFNAVVRDESGIFRIISNYINPLSYDISYICAFTVFTVCGRDRKTPVGSVSIKAEKVRYR